MSSAIPAEQLVAANEAAAAFYRQMLLGPGGEGPRSYLTSRGFSSLLRDTPWTVGYAPAGWTTTVDHLRAQGFDDHALLEAGVASLTSRGTLMDRFRDRITFGIRDPSGRLVAFVGRAAPNSGSRSPKYLGTPTTMIYRKGDVLLGYSEQRQRVTAHRSFAIVEGPLDAVAIWEATDSIGLALCGTALTRGHARLLALTAPAVVLCLDGDSAGRAATGRSLPMLWEQQLDTKVAELPRGDDPASTSRTGLSGAIEHATPGEKAIVKIMLEGRHGLEDNVEAQLGALKHAARVLAAAPPPNEALAAHELARRTHLGYDAVTAHLAAALSSGLEKAGVVQLPPRVTDLCRSRRADR
jgi:DNA primase